MITTLILYALASAPAVQEREIVRTSVLEAEIAAAVEAAGRRNQRVLVHWSDPASERGRELDSLFTENRDLARKLLYEYRVVRVSAVEDEAVKATAMQHGAVLVADTPHLTVLDAAGRAIANVDANQLLEAEKIDAKKVQELLEKHQAPAKSATELLTAAQTEAGGQQKRVFLILERPECKSCHQLDARLTAAEVKPVLDQEFVFLSVDLERTKGAKELAEKLHGPQTAETPWYVVLDGAGAPVVDSDDLTGSNLGCPQTKEELEAWGAMLKRARQRLSDEEVEQVVTAFRLAAERKETKEPPRS